MELKVPPIGSPESPSISGRAPSDYGSINRGESPPLIRRGDV